jgi:trimeric autotransporter adhesin
MKSITQTILIAMALLSVEVGGTKMYAISPPPGDFYPGGNTAIGQQAFLFLTTGQYNTAVGFLSQSGNATASFNTAVGAGALLSNTAEGNTATGAGALLANTTGIENTAIGESALFSSVDGDRNTAVGADALVNNTGGAFNVAAGFNALGENTTGGSNIALGGNALSSNVVGSNNTAIGAIAGINSTGDGNVYVGAGVIGVAGESNHTYVRNIKNTSVSGGNSDTVTLDLTTGLLGHLSSSLRYKENIQPMGAASDLLYRLKPVTFRYKKDVDRTQSSTFGLIAEQVAEVSPELVTCNSDGQPEGVHYEQVNAMLLNEFLKEHRTVVELKEEIAALAATVKEQAMQLQKVTDEIGINRSVPQIVLSDQ